MNSPSSQNGFSLVETVIAAAIVASTGLVLIALLGQITEQTGDLAQGAAIRRASATIRHFTQNQDFEEMYLKIKGGEPLELAIYDYHAEPGQVREDGSLEPASEREGSTLVSAARWLEDPILSGDLAASPDFVFRAELQYTGEKELPEDSGDFPSVSLPLELQLWEMPADAIEKKPGRNPDHVFHVHIFR